MPNIALKVAINGLKQKVKDIHEGINFLKKTEVVVGIPHENDSEHEGGLTNAELLYIQCMGSPANNIPPRNVLNAVYEDGTQEQIKACLRSGIRKAITGNVNGARQEYEKAGMVGQSAVRARFGTIPPPNKPATVARKGSSATLIDTGALRAAITYAVRDKKK